MSETFKQYIERHRQKFLKLTEKQEKELARLFIEAAGDIKEKAQSILDKKSLSYAQAKIRINSLLRDAARLSDNFEGVLDRALIEAADLGMEVNKISMSQYQRSLKTNGVNIDMTRILSKVNIDAVAYTYSKIYTDGLMLSDRIWLLERRAKNEIERIIMQNVISGGSASDKATIAALENLLNPSYKPAKLTSLHGRRVGYEASRLLRTEMSVAFNEANRISAERNPGSTGLTWLIAIGACESCVPLDGKPVSEVGYPPLHPNCFDKETEVLTDNGWKLFSDILGSEKILSVDLKNGQSEWVNIKEKVSYLFNGKLVSYKSNNCDLVVTPDHNQVVMFRDKEKGRKDFGYWKLEQEKDLPNYDFKFLGTIPNYKGLDIDKIRIGKYEFDIESFVEFLGYYLSEGSISKPTRGKWQIKITQNESDSKEIMLASAKMLFGKIWNGKNAFYIPLLDEELIDYFKKLGKSYNKYIPREIKELDKRYLKIFLDAYILGDGSIRKGKFWKGYLFGGERTYFTSSERLASDIGEIILKIGNRPSYYYKKDTEYTKHKNGLYLTKHNCWRIRENITTTPNRDNLRKTLVDYNDYVYDVELEKYHTLFVRRKGKVLLSGNCRCTTLNEVQSVEDFTDRYIKFMDNPESDKKLGDWLLNVYKKAA